MTAIIEDDETIKQKRAEYSKNYYNTNEDYRTRRIQKAREYYRTKSKTVLGGGIKSKTIIQPKQKKIGLLQRKTERIKKELALIEKKANAFREKLKNEVNIIYDE